MTKDRPTGDLIHWLALRLREGVGERRVERLYRRLGSPARVRGELSPEPELGEQRARRLIERCRAADIRILTRTDSAYPARLARLVDPPMVLFARGDLHLLQRPAVTIVGSRRATEYGRRAARALGAALVERGLVVVSGLAKGIDSAAHRGALGAKGPTVAVVGGGIGVLTGSRDRPIREVARDGLLVSEFLPDERPQPFHFPKRNRLLAALGSAVVVVEAGRRSGALITVRHALDLGSTVWAVPGPLWRASSHATLRLIEDGARIVVDVDEAADAMVREISVEYGTALPAPAPMGGTGTSPGNRAADPIYDATGSEPRTLDDLVTLSGLSSDRVATGILRLEMAGRVVRLPGMRYVRPTGRRS